ncbi:Large ribosomal subunit protein mL67 [Nakaseomyces bracarensis]|uniref:Large ribosomal subunit protein mL67 n=1 Tax=Nakaseomyces bracarensis TaxID=273131 RepID=A0ABR4NS73_9SACH
MSAINKATSRFRTAAWLEKAGYSPWVYLYRNLALGQVMYSQLPEYGMRNLKTQFKRPNWENKFPEMRRDVWRIMCVVQMPTHTDSVQVYQNLCRLRYMRDVLYKDEARKHRKLNDEGQVWFSGQFRPTYIQEAVADVRESLLHSGTAGPVKLVWEDLWRMGDKSHWETLPFNVKHTAIPKMGNVIRDEHAMLKQLALEANMDK